MGGVLDTDELKVPLIPASGENLGGLGQSSGEFPKRIGCLPLRTVSLNLFHKASDESVYSLTLGNHFSPLALCPVGCDSKSPCPHCIDQCELLVQKETKARFTLRWDAVQSHLAWLGRG